MFLPTGLLNRHLWLSRASPSTDHRSSARSDAAMTEGPGSARLGADPSLGDRAFPKPWLKCARTLSHQTPQSACSSLLVLWFTLPCSGWSLLPSYGHSPCYYLQEPQALWVLFSWPGFKFQCFPCFSPSTR